MRIEIACTDNDGFPKSGVVAVDDGEGAVHVNAAESDHPAADSAQHLGAESRLGHFGDNLLQFQAGIDIYPTQWSDRVFVPYAMDLTPLVNDPAQSPQAYMQEFVQRFTQEVNERLARLT